VAVEPTPILLGNPLLLTHAFETQGCRVVGCTDSFAIASQRAIAALGARLDGVIRASPARRDGTVRDTVTYGILATERPDVKRQLTTRLAPHGTPGAGPGSTAASG
jgi:hypothetical protein